MESRRGGGGYIRVIRICHQADDYLRHLLRERIGTALTAAEAEAILRSLEERQLVTGREAALARAAVSGAALSLPLNIQDTLRAQILRAMVQQLAYHPKEES